MHFCEWDAITEESSAKPGRGRENQWRPSASSMVHYGSTSVSSRGEAHPGKRAWTAGIAVGLAVVCMVAYRGGLALAPSAANGRPTVLSMKQTNADERAVLDDVSTIPSDERLAESEVPPSPPLTTLLRATPLLPALPCHALPCPALPFYCCSPPTFRTFTACSVVYT